MTMPGLPELLIVTVIAFGVIAFFVVLVALLFALRRRTARGPTARLSSCPDCRNLCSPRAAACPKCGCPLEMTSRD